MIKMNKILITMKFITYIDSLKKIPTFKGKDIAKISLLLEKSGNLWDKIWIGSINQKEHKQFTTFIKKLMNLKCFHIEILVNLLRKIQYYP